MTIFWLDLLCTVLATQNIKRKVLTVTRASNANGWKGRQAPKEIKLLKGYMYSELCKPRQGSSVHDILISKLVNIQTCDYM